jgi:septum formation protein
VISVKLVLASASERRHELLRRITKTFDIIVSGFDEEEVCFQGDFGEYVKKLSMGKAYDVAKKLEGECIIVGCDTIVAFDGKVLGKPKSRQDAQEMLEVLSGNMHSVYSGITLVNTSTGKIITDYIKTDVKFSPLAKEDIEAYIDTGEPMDKAGAYGIQGYGGVFVEEIHGCYYNVVGLPLNRLKFMLRDMGVSL